MQKLRVIWYKVWARIAGKVVNLFASQTNYEIENTILIIGTTRSGTTFLMESLNAHYDYRLIFEPFNPTYTAEWQAHSAREYIDPEEVPPHMDKKVENILCGRIQNEWVDRYNRKLRSERRIVKAVRANLMVDYLEYRFPKMPIVYIYRDPYAVVASRIKLNFDARDVFIILEQKVFLAKKYPHIDVDRLKLLLDCAEKCHAALWCLENLYLLRTLKQRRLLVTRFEDVVGKTIGIKDGHLRITDLKRRPSVTTSRVAPYHLSDSERSNVKGVLEFFGMAGGDWEEAFK